MVIMEKKKVGAIALGTIAVAGAGVALYAYKKNTEKKQRFADEVYNEYELNHANSSNYGKPMVEDFKDDSVKKQIKRRGK